MTKMSWRPRSPSGRYRCDAAISRRDVSDIWYQIAKGREASGDLEGAEQARRNGRLYRGKLMTEGD